MPLFQQSVLNKFLEALPKEQVYAAWGKFSSHFQNPTVRQHISNLKEEEYQEGFVRDLFVHVLAYTLKPQPDYNLVLEQKSTTDTTKSDGAILKDGNVIGVIELKDTRTTDLKGVEKQAFGYKHQHKDCKYVIISNFRELRLYINDAVEFEAFDLFYMDKASFDVLYCCLHKDAIDHDVPLKMKQLSIAEEENVTKKLYADYSKFRSLLFDDIVSKNPQFDRLELFQKTQKLLDRFLFILFAEDRSLLTPNSVRIIMQRWQTLKDVDAYKPLYDMFRQYFGYLNTGYTGKDFEVYPYNGGLFAPDEILDAIAIDDKLLYDSCMSLSNYNFMSEVDVNILGHIFEHSLTEFEKIQQEIEAGTDAHKHILDKKETRRKKEGVYYTPRYITKYIVENTVGVLCQQKKAELQIVEDEYLPQKKKAAAQALSQKLDQYREWLLQLTICDPACGSGAFLNQALEHLIQEHHTIDALKAKLSGTSFFGSDVEKSILENNLFGVDINEEAVEIAKLSLWLRTAKKDRKLSDLSKHIRCGNSLIDDPAVAGDKAFNWEKEFPEVFEKGGFDVVIGNPPYLRVQGLRANFEKETIYYENKFVSATGRFDIYALFIERAFGLISENGIYSFILPHKFMISDYGAGLRNFLNVNQAISSIISFGSAMVFSDASTYTCIIKCSKLNSNILYKQIEPSQLFENFKFDSIPYSELGVEKWNIQSNVGSSLFNKLYRQPFTAKDIFDNISQGIVSIGDDIFILKGQFSQEIFSGFSERLNQVVDLEKSLMKPLLKGDEVKKYEPPMATHYIIYPHYNKNGKTIPYTESEMQINFPLTYSYLAKFKEELINKKIRYKTNPAYWFSLHRSREISLFEQVKIITPETSFGTNLTIDEKFTYHNTQVYSFIKKENIPLDYKFLLAILNSTILWYFLKNTGNILRGGFFRFKTAVLLPFPFPDYRGIDQNPFIERVELILLKSKQLQEMIGQMLRLINEKYHRINPSNKLQNWPTLSFGEFLKELSKFKIKLKLTEESEWMQYFEAEKAKAKVIQDLIEKTDKEIDQMVYELYGLTEEEVRVVEGEN